MGSAVRPAKSSPASWDAFSDLDAFVDAVLSELTAMAADGTRPTRPGPKPPLAGAALRKAIMALWCVCFCGMHWRAIGQLSGLRFGTLYTLFARWTRLGLWRQLLDRLRRTWPSACGDAPEPSAVILDSRSCRSAPSCFERGIDGGKNIKGVKVQVGVDKYGILLAIDVAPANVHDTKGIIPVLPRAAPCCANLPGAAFRAPRWGISAIGRLAKAGEALGITIKPSAGGRGGTVIPEGIRWVVERSFAWLACYRRLNTIAAQTKEHRVAFVEIAFVSILSRRLKRLSTQDISA